MSNTDIPPQLQLNPQTVDYDAIYTALQSDLVARGTWTDLATSGTGSLLMKWIASCGASFQGAVARSIQELFLDTARSPSGILRCARLQGTPIIRARAGSVQVSVHRTDGLTTSLVIPAYTQWAVGGFEFINRAAINLPSDGSAVSVVLYWGALTNESHISSGTGFQIFDIGVSNAWAISNDDLMVIDANGTLWTSITGGLWRESAGSYTFWASTLPDGRVRCVFGDGTYGSLLPVGNFNFIYTTLLPASTTNANLPPVGSRVTVGNYVVTGTSTATASPNLDAPPPDFYKTMGPGGATNNGRGVTRDDLRAIALKYDGVIDALFQGQAELNPADSRYSCVVAVTLLTTAPWTALQWTNFKFYLETEVGIANITYIRVDPTPVPITIPVSLTVFQNADLPSLQSLATQVVTNFVTPQAGSLGASYYPSDLTVRIMEVCTYQEAPNEVGALVDTITVPPNIVQLQRTQYFVLNMSQVSVTYTTRSGSPAFLQTIIGL